VFRWPSGLLELPSPVLGLGRFRLPHLGGVYFRVLPRAVVRRLDRWSSPCSLPWFYCHAYDFDVEEEFWALPGMSRAMSRLVWVNRDQMWTKTARLFADGAAPPFADRLTEAATRAVVHHPAPVERP
jgi:hypothetical protein